MNANININSYYNRPLESSMDIRRAYMANTRRREMRAFTSRLLANPTVWTVLFALKIICGIACAIALFTIIGLTESGEISSLSGIFSAIIIAAFESLCFIPIGKNSQKTNDRSH